MSYGVTNISYTHPLLKLYIMIIFYLLFFLSVSDRCFAGEADDKSGSTIESAIKSGKFVDNAEISLKDCVPDEVSIIRVNLMSSFSNIIRMKFKLTMQIRILE